MREAPKESPSPFSWHQTSSEPCFHGMLSGMKNGTMVGEPLKASMKLNPLLRQWQTCHYAHDD